MKLCYNLHKSQVSHPFSYVMFAIIILITARSVPGYRAGCDSALTAVTVFLFSAPFTEQPALYLPAAYAYQAFPYPLLHSNK